MKFLQLFIALSFLIFTNLNIKAENQTIPNGDFEIWQSNSELSNWNTTNKFGTSMGIFPVSKDSIAESGKFSILMKTYSTPIGMNIPSVISLGDIAVGSVSGGIAFNSRPKSLTGFYIHPTFGDAPLVAVMFFRHNGSNLDTLGGGKITLSDSTTSYKQFVINLSYKSESEPDLMNIVISTDANHPGSTLLIDNLQFNYGSDVITNPFNNSNNIKIYPNPANDFLIIENNQFSGSFQINILDILGTKVCDYTVNSGSNMIDLSNLKSGVYFISYNIYNTIHQDKIIIER
jgi:hypothetical protein